MIGLSKLVLEDARSTSCYWKNSTDLYGWQGRQLWLYDQRCQDFHILRIKWIWHNFLLLFQQNCKKASANYSGESLETIVFGFRFVFRMGSQLLQSQQKEP